MFANGFEKTHKVYTVSLEYSFDYGDGLEIEVFSTYEKAVKRFKELVKIETQPGMSWAAEAFEDGKLLHGYDLDASADYADGKEHEHWWYINCKNDWHCHTFIELRFAEVQ